jgi:hypothetical protein
MHCGTLTNAGFSGTAALLLLVSSVLCGFSQVATGTTLETEHFAARLEGGFFTALINRATEEDYLPREMTAPVLQVEKAGKLSPPQGMAWLTPGREFRLDYTDIGVKVVIGVEAKMTHITLRVLSITPAEGVESIGWGPYPTTISGLIGGQVGVARNKEFSIGIQSLNAKTVGGAFTEGDGYESERGVFSLNPRHGGDPPDPHFELYGYNPYIETRIGPLLPMGSTAQPQEYGSRLQAFCTDWRTSKPPRPDGRPEYADAIDDGGVIGSAIALFGCPEPETLDTIGAIELAEGLPHPTFNGEWLKTSQQGAPIMFIIEYGEDTIDDALDLTERAGLNMIYCWKDLFKSWGHFQLNPERWPNGWEGLRQCAQKAEKRGIRLGFKTLSNFIAPTDPYVTPVPDPRLARIGSSVLAGDIDAAAREIPIEDPSFFRQNSRLRTVMIGQELIRFGGVSPQAPWKLILCSRGAFHTKPSVHRAAAPVHYLNDTAFRSGKFFGNYALSMEIAMRLAQLCNETGLSYMAHDGLEGNGVYGWGDYGLTLFSQTWYDAMTPEVRKWGPMLEASRPTHFNWHTITHYGWGEMWSSGQDFRTWHTDYRYMRQYGYRRNLLPNMLGFYYMGLEDSLEDIEWLMARAVGFDAGFLMALPADDHPQLGECLDAIREWNAVRLHADLPQDLKWALQDDRNDCHLRPIRPGKEWDLQLIRSFKAYIGSANLPPKAGQRIKKRMNAYRYSETTEKTKGVGKYNPDSEVVVDNANPAQPAWIILTNIGSQPIKNLTVECAGSVVLTNPGVLDVQGQLELKDGALQLSPGARHLCREPKTLAARSNVILPQGQSLFRITWDEQTEEQGLDVDIRSIAEPVRISTRATP